MPLSNPTRSAEATPRDLLHWTEGKALVATGSPFDPVTLGDTSVNISQANNVYIFPGLGLGATAANATQITDRMLTAAAETLAHASPKPSTPSDGLLPPLQSLHQVSRRIAAAVAVAAGEDGVAQPLSLDDARKKIERLWWEPTYPTITSSAALRA